MGILKTDSAYQTISLKGVGPEYDLRFMRQQMVEGRIPQWKGDKVMISTPGASTKKVISKRI